MAALGILIGTANYQKEQQLPCCPRDVEMVASLLEATGRFDAIHKFVDRDAAELKRELRGVLQPLESLDELFFYFSGHGHAEEGEFYFCTVDFDRDRPNVTGLSHSELMVIIRDLSPDITVQVIDACNSGTRLLKSTEELFPIEKSTLKNLVRIAACGETETAITGSQLSPFTERFCLAATRPGEGPVYYTDIIGALRDEYRRDSDRTPQFVLQASARETFIDDAQQLADFRSKLTAEWGDLADANDAVTIEVGQATPNSTLAERLAALDARMAKKEAVPVYIDRLFNGLLERLGREEFGDAFDLATAEHKDFQEQTTRGFIIRVLNQEKRPDEFVSASITKHRKKRNSLFPDLSALALSLSTDDEITETWDLELNMRMERAQLRITLTPKFSILQRIILVVSCAPSLERCYVFELATRHPRTDWDSFAVEGVEFTRRWYKEPWTNDPSPLIEKIVAKLVSDVEELMEQTALRLSDDAG